ncbi:MAG: ORF6N domain-containing protein [Candidatus Edwardsbacteria bacterium]|nr:ORF6N domain-containing protein [Candidatus Edwardsbacteria bacterium]
MNAISSENITACILVIRNQRVLLDADWARLYGVSAKRLNEQVKRNSGRFPPDFAFRLTKNEFENLKSQFATSSWGGKRKLPLAFTEHGAIKAATVLNSPQAVQMSVFVMRAFIKLRQLASDYQASYRKIAGMEQRYDAQFRGVFAAVKRLMEPPMTKRKKICFLSTGRRSKC